MKSLILIIFYFIVWAFGITTASAQLNYNSESSISVKKGFMDISDYPAALKGSTIKLYQPIKMNDVSNSAKVFYIENSDYYYSLINEYLYKINKHNFKILDKIEIEYSGPCTAGGCESVIELNASKWSNVDFMLHAVRYAECCDAPLVTYIIIDANDKLQIMKQIYEGSYYSDVESCSYSDNLFLPDNPISNKIWLLSTTEKTYEASKKNKIKRKKTYYKWNGNNLVEL